MSTLEAPGTGRYTRRMADVDLDATRMIGGFPLPEIKRALCLVGINEDRNDLTHAASRLKCGTKQARRVLDDLVDQGFVSKARKRNQWDLTDTGRDLVYRWQPPRRFVPAIDRDGPTRNEMTESVPCLILRSTDANNDVFEEALVEVGISDDFETDAVIEFSVHQPDMYNDSDGSGVVAMIACVSIADAKKYAQGLERAIAKAESNEARRAKARARAARRSQKHA